jgi:hypothetical protein
MNDKLAEWVKATKSIAQLEEALEKVKSLRAETCKLMLEENGRGHLYDVDGAQMIVVTSKNGVCFLTPKRGGRPRVRKIQAEVKMTKAQESESVIIAEAKVTEDKDPLEKALADIT